MTATIVTALYDIGREKIDGRGMSQYYEWFSKTLLIQCPMVIYCENSHVDFIKKHRPKNLKTQIIVQELKDIPYYYLKERMDKVLSDPDFISRVSDPNRIECKTSLYSIIQYSKFKWVLDASKKNFFNSDYFFWFDAGASRFIPDIDTSTVTFPGENFIKQIKMHSGKTLYQMYVFPYNNISLRNTPLDHDYLYDSRSYVWGGMFGVDKIAIENLSKIVEEVLIHEMLDKNLLNNEQIAIGYLLKKNNDSFLILRNNSQQHRNFELIYQTFS